ncbi:hypothetical protein MA16_Dca021908 [Dendrobium catenatum]|uniref:Uncharacterized protein n=1 Tax=Dendrobium catenatum TaxID=906689 RepID=A0A2I0WD47_9ASPA|nr:hypothetical protein MA16_Dca021908 [Dendrobium catenatum]
MTPTGEATTIVEGTREELEVDVEASSIGELRLGMLDWAGSRASERSGMSDGPPVVPVAPPAVWPSAFNDGCTDDFANISGGKPPDSTRTGGKPPDSTRTGGLPAA